MKIKGIETGLGRKALKAVFIANIISVPLLFIAMPLSLAWGYENVLWSAKVLGSTAFYPGWANVLWKAFLVGEVAVFLLEAAVVYKLASGIKAKDAFVLSFCANLASFLIGILFALETRNAVALLHGMGF